MKRIAIAILMLGGLAVLPPAGSAGVREQLCQKQISSALTQLSKCPKKKTAKKRAKCTKSANNRLNAARNLCAKSGGGPRGGPRGGKR